MSITFDNVNVNWSDLFRDKMEWVRMYGVGIPLSMLFNYWLYLPLIPKTTFLNMIFISFFAFGTNATWGLVFGLVSGLVRSEDDFILQIVRSFIGAIILYIFVGIFSLMFFSVVFGLLISVTIGFVPGFLLHNYFDKKVLKTAEKEIEARQYVDYRTIE